MNPAARMKALAGGERTVKEETPELRSTLLALARQGCVKCLGLGATVGPNRTGLTCHCVYRNVFRVCLARFRQCTSKEKYVSRVSLEANPGGRRKHTWGLKNEEYIADFCLVAQRALGRDTQRHRIFRFHFLLGAEQPEISRRIGLDRGEYFHELYRIESILGHAFCSTEPYALFPVDEYFSTSGGRSRTKLPGDVGRRITRLKFPLTPRAA